MGDLGEFWRDVSPMLKEESRAKKKSNLEKSIAILDQYGISYVTKDEIHFIIESSIGRIDFWPSTGLYKGAANGRGVFNLIAAIKEDKERTNR